MTAIQSLTRDYAGRYSLGLKKRVVDLMAEGKSSVQIERITGVDQRLVRAWGKYAGIRNAHSHKRHSQEEKGEVLKLYNKGYGTTTISRTLGIDKSLIWHWLRQFGIPARTYGEGLKLQYENGLKTRNLFTYPHIKMPSHPRSKSNGYVQEHILVWERVHNKPLPKGWVIHHLNGIKIDNRPENLKAMPEMKHRTVLATKAQRIRELEEKVKILEKALDNSQMLLGIGEN